MSHLSWIAWDRPLGDDNYTSRCGSTYGHAGTTVSYRTLRPCTLTGTLCPRLSLLPFHTVCPVLILEAMRLVGSRGVRHRAVLSVLSSAAVRVLAMSSTGKYRGRTRALHRYDLRIALSPSSRASNVAISAHNRPAGACPSLLHSLEKSVARLRKFHRSRFLHSFSQFVLEIDVVGFCSSHDCNFSKNFKRAFVWILIPVSLPANYVYA